MSVFIFSFSFDARPIEPVQEVIESKQAESLVVEGTFEVFKSLFTYSSLHVIFKTREGVLYRHL